MRLARGADDKNVNDPTILAVQAICQERPLRERVRDYRYCRARLQWCWRTMTCEYMIQASISVDNIATKLIVNSSRDFR